MHTASELRILVSSPRSAIFRLFDYDRDGLPLSILSSTRLWDVIAYDEPDIFIHFDSHRTAVEVEILFDASEMTDEEVEVADQNEEAFLSMPKDEQNVWFEKTIPENRYFKLVDNGAETGTAYLLLKGHPAMSGSSGVAKRLSLAAIMQYGGPEIDFEMNHDDVVIGIKVYGDRLE